MKQIDKKDMPKNMKKPPNKAVIAILALLGVAVVCVTVQSIVSQVQKKDKPAPVDTSTSQTDSAIDTSEPETVDETVPTVEDEMLDDSSSNSDYEEKVTVFENEDDDLLAREQTPAE